MADGLANDKRAMLLLQSVSQTVSRRPLGLCASASTFRPPYLPPAIVYAYSVLCSGPGRASPGHRQSLGRRTRRDERIALARSLRPLRRRRRRAPINQRARLPRSSAQLSPASDRSSVELASKACVGRATLIRELALCGAMDPDDRLGLRFGRSKFYEDLFAPLLR